MSNSIHISRIQEGIDQIKNIGRKEKQFQINNQPFAVRTLTPKEEDRVAEYCERWRTRMIESNDRILEQQWLRRRRIETLAYAFVQIGRVDFRGIDLIQTGQTDQNGQPITKEKHIYLRNMLEDWNEDVQRVCFRKYMDLKKEVRSELDDEVEFDDDTLDARIEKKREELERLEREKRDREQPGREDAAPHGSDVSKGDLEEELYSPERAENIDVDDITLEEEVEDKPESSEDSQPQPNPQPESREQMKESVQRQRQDQHGGTSRDDLAYQTKDGEFVDQDGEPLEGQDLDRAAEMERLYQEKYGDRGHQQQRNSDRDGQGREPMNRQNARIQEGDLPEERPQERQQSQQRQRQRAQRERHQEDIPVADHLSDGPEVLSDDPSAGKEPRDFDDIETNPSPHEHRSDE